MGYKIYDGWSTMPLFIILAMEWLIDQKTQESNLKTKQMHMRTRRKANGIGHILCKNITEWKKQGKIEVIERQDISSYRMTLKKREDTGN
jgi:light-regulated signal transduction histidine kinase (bacteriophytochrome)